MNARPRVLLLSLGGTIAMVPDQQAGGAVPRLGAEDLLAAVPALAEVATIRAESFRQLPGAHLTLSHIVALADRIKAELRTGEVDGVVVTQGTDTLEEVAFALDLLLDAPEPIVVTGAMRAAHLPGADGPANLLDAVSVAGSPEFRGIGSVVVMGGEVHAARFVVKAHTQSPSAFFSPATGAVGWVAEGRPRLLLRPAARLELELPEGLETARVALITSVLGDDGALIRAAAHGGFEGMVIEGLGGGHLPEAALKAIDEALTAMPVVLSSRTQVGEILRTTYGFAGSETDLLARGLLSSAWLGARKARVLLALLLGDRSAAASAPERFVRYLSESAPA